MPFFTVPRPTRAGSFGLCVTFCVTMGQSLSLSLFPHVKGSSSSPWGDLESGFGSGSVLKGGILCSVVVSRIRCLQRDSGDRENNSLDKWLDTKFRSLSREGALGSMAVDKSPLPRGGGERAGVGEGTGPLQEVLVSWRCRASPSLSLSVLVCMMGFPGHLTSTHDVLMGLSAPHTQ